MHTCAGIVPHFATGPRGVDSNADSVTFILHSKRVSYSGSTSAFQAEDTGSIPVTRSSLREAEAARRSKSEGGRYFFNLGFATAGRPASFFLFAKRRLPARFVLVYLRELWRYCYAAITLPSPSKNLQSNTPNPPCPISVSIFPPRHLTFSMLAASCSPQMLFADVRIFLTHEEPLDFSNA